MTKHYYDKLPDAKHNRQRIEETINGIKLGFTTDAGVFSKQGVDFGSKLLIQSFTAEEPATILDVGCGYGPIGLFIAKRYANSQVSMLDINSRAVALARENASLNQIRNVSIRESDLYEAVRTERFTHIVSNPPIRAGKDVVHRIFTEAVELLETDGELWIVIQKKQGAPSAWTKLQSLFAEVTEVTKQKGYRIFKAVKR